MSLKPTRITTNHSETSLSQATVSQAITEKICRLERDRIARDLHDELGQLLSTMRLNLHGLKMANGAQATSSAELDKMHDLLNRAQAATKSIVHDLRSADQGKHEADFNLFEQVKVHIAAFESETGISCALSLKHAADFDQLPKEQQLALFRVLQESLTNTLKHAVATKVKICIFKAHSQYVLTVKDNGRGINKSNLTSKTHSFGLIGMRERIAIFNGAFSAKNCIWGGTEITAKLPAKDKAIQLSTHGRANNKQNISLRNVSIITGFAFLLITAIEI